MYIDTFEVIEQVNQSTYRFKIVCGSGTYIRALGRDLAYKLDSLATMTSLIRTRVGVFNLENACNLDDNLAQNLLPCEVVLQKLGKEQIDEDTLLLLKQGKKVPYTYANSDLFRMYYSNTLLVLGKVEEGLLKMKIWLL